MERIEALARRFLETKGWEDPWLPTILTTTRTLAKTGQLGEHEATALRAIDLAMKVKHTYLPGSARGFTAEELAARKARIGASEIATIMGRNPFEGPEGPRTVWARKVGAAPEDAFNHFMEWGLRHEITIINKLSDIYGPPWEPGTIVSSAYRHVGCTPDVIFQDARVGVQIKTGSSEYSGVSEWYRLQCVYEMAVFSEVYPNVVDRWELATLAQGSNFQRDPIDYDPEEGKELLTFAQNWYESYVETGAEPPLAIRHEDVMEADGSLNTLIDLLVANQAAEKKAKGNVKTIKAQLETRSRGSRSILGANKNAHKQGGSVRSSLDQGMLKREYPAIAAKCMVDRPSASYWKVSK